MFEPQGGTVITVRCRAKRRWHKRRNGGRRSFVLGRFVWEPPDDFEMDPAKPPTVGRWRSEMMAKSKHYSADSPATESVLEIIRHIEDREMRGMGYELEGDVWVGLEPIIIGDKSHYKGEYTRVEIPRWGPLGMEENRVSPRKALRQFSQKENGWGLSRESFRIFDVKEPMPGFTGGLTVTHEGEPAEHVYYRMECPCGLHIPDIRTSALDPILHAMAEHGVPSVEIQALMRRLGY